MISHSLEKIQKYVKYLVEFETNWSFRYLLIQMACTSFILSLPSLLKENSLIVSDMLSAVIYIIGSYIGIKLACSMSNFNPAYIIKGFGGDTFLKILKMSFIYKNANKKVNQYCQNLDMQLFLVTNLYKIKSMNMYFESQRTKALDNLEKGNYANFLHYYIFTMNNYSEHIDENSPIKLLHPYCRILEDYRDKKINSIAVYYA